MAQRFAAWHADASTFTYPGGDAVPVFRRRVSETFRELLKNSQTLRRRLLDIPGLEIAGLRDCQIRAITNLEKSFRSAKPRALIQMTTGSGKTYTAITFIYRLLKFAKAKRVLFLGV